MLNLIWDGFQQRQIKQASDTAHDAKKKAREGAISIYELEDRVARLSLINRAIWSFVKEKNHLDDIDLWNKIEELDLSDGKRDGKINVGVKTCPSCNRKNSGKYLSCIYCGFEDKQSSPFETI